MERVNPYLLNVFDLKLLSDAVYSATCNLNLNYPQYSNVIFKEYI
jgi:hypothetical protein